ncbi:MAG TPA: hypothetical protein VFH80_28325 [Solirubrobacteraceae bacterium]|nr:hypothetical protein [Solirubrobacteraceae bacterium]
MAGNTANAGRWASADVYVAPLGTTAPTTETGALDPAWKALGLLDPSDGVVNALSESSSTLKAWGNITVEVVNSDFVETFKFTPVEDNDTVFGLVYEGSATPTVATGTETRVAKAPQRVSQAWLIELRNGSKTKRIVIPKAKISDVGDRNFNETDLSKTQITVTVEAAADGTLHNEIQTASV